MLSSEGRYFSVFMLAPFFLVLSAVAGTALDNSSLDGNITDPCAGFAGTCFVPIDEFVNESDGNVSQNYTFIDVEALLNTTFQENSSAPISDSLANFTVILENESENASVYSDESQNMTEDLIPDNISSTDIEPDNPPAIEPPDQSTFVDVGEFLEISDNGTIESDDLNMDGLPKTIHGLTIISAADSIFIPVDDFINITNTPPPEITDLTMQLRTSAGLASNFTWSREDISEMSFRDGPMAWAVKEALDKSLDVTLTFSDHPIKEVQLHGVNPVGGDISFGVEALPLDTPAPEGERWLKAYALDPTTLNFTSGTLTAVASGNALYKCRTWDFESQNCTGGNWELIRTDLVPGEEYTLEITSDDPGFGEANITVIDLQSYPEINGEWAVRFTTVGVADLWISAVDGTTWDLGDGDYDLRFMELRCGNDTIPYSWINNSVYVPSFSCNETGSETSRVLTAGKHHLEFRFGDSVKYAHNQAGVDVILLRGAGGDVNSTTDINITWSIEDREDADTFNHSTSSNTHEVEVLKDGIYRVSYGLYVTTAGGGRDVTLSHLVEDGANAQICYGSGYNRGATSSQDMVAQGECLISLNAGQIIGIAAKRNSTSDAEAPSLVSADSWMHVQRLDESNVILLREASGGDAFDATNISVTWDTEVVENSTFNHTAGSSEVQVQQAGFYRVTYGVMATKNNNNRASAFGALQVQPDGGSFAYVPFGWSHTNQRGTTDTQHGVLSASTILNLSALDTVQLIVGRASTNDPGSQTVVGNAMHFDMEYLGNQLWANTMMVHDAAGGDDIDPGPFDQTWDTEDWEGTDFSYTPTGSEITVSRTGLYHISYGVYTERPTGGTRFEWITSLRVNNVEQDVCFGSGYNRGDQGSYPSMSGGSESSCYIELSSGDTVEIRNTKVSSGTDQTINTVGNKIYLTLQSMDFLGPTPPNVTLNAPENNSNFSGVGNIILNASVTDPSDDNMSVRFFAGNSTSISFAHGLVYEQDNVPNGTTVTYNITALPFVPQPNSVLLLHYDNRSEFGESSTLAYDFSGTGNNATCAGVTCPTFNQTGGKFAGAFELDGSDDYWDIDNGYFDRAVVDYTIEVWFNANDVSTSTDQFLFEEGGNVNGLNAYIRDGMVFVGAWSETDGWNGEWLNFTTTSNEWHYVALLFEGNNQMTMVYDGQNKSVSIPSGVAAHGGDDFIGRMGGSSKTDEGDQTGGPTYYFNGTIDDFVIRNTTISVHDALDHYKLGPGSYFWYANVSDWSNHTVSETWQFNIRGPITDCIVISEAGNYFLERDLYGAPHSASETSEVNFACIKIASDDVNLTCDGYSIVHDLVGLAAGIVVNGSSSVDYTNVTIHDCPAISSYYVGAYIFNSQQDVIRNVTAINSGLAGIYTLGGVSNQIEDSVSSVSLNHGIYLRDTYTTNITNCTAQGSSMYGIYVYTSQSNTVNESLVYNNTNHGIYIRSYVGADIHSQFNSVFNSTSRDNGGDGIRTIVTSGDSIIDNNFSNNSGSGVHLDTSSLFETIRNIRSYNNTLNGFTSVTGVNLADFDDLIAYHNLLAGFNVSGATSILADNVTAYRNRDGLAIYLGSLGVTGAEVFNNTRHGVHYQTSTSASYYDVHTYNNGNLSILADNSGGGGAPPILFENLTIDSPAGNYQNYTILNITDNINANSAYSINWTSNSSALPASKVLFNGKLVDISTVAGTTSIDSIVWSWLEPETVGYEESRFELWKYNASWTMLNNTPNIAANTLSQTNMNPQSDYGILSAIPLNITNITATPDPQGFGFNVTMQAFVAGASTVLAEITPPSGGPFNITMTNITAVHYIAYYSDWTNGTYNYTIFANDSSGLWWSSQAYNFSLYQNLTLQVRTLKQDYTVNESINLTDPEKVDDGKPRIMNSKVGNFDVLVEAGDAIPISVDLTDKVGIESVTAYIPTKKGRVNVSLRLLNGTIANGTWAGWWRAHDLIGHHFIVLIEAKNRLGETHITHVSVADPPGLWILPTNDSDPTGLWTNGPNARDGDTHTYAEDNSNPGGGWGSFIYFNVSPIQSDRVRVWSDYGIHVSAIDVDVYMDGNWSDAYQGAIPSLSWAQINFTQGNITQGRFRFNYAVGGWIYWLYEFQFYNVTTKVNLPVISTRPATSVEDNTSVLHATLLSDGGDGCKIRFVYGNTTSFGSSTSWVSDQYTGSLVGQRIFDLQNNTQYYFMAQVNNSAGITNGSMQTFTTGTASPGWVSPTNYTDPNGEWNNELNAMDDEIYSEASSYHEVNDPDGVWSFYLYLNRSTILSDSIRFMAKATDVDLANIDIYNGSWYTVYNSSFTDSVWTTASFNQTNLSAARIRFRAIANNRGFDWALAEFDFYKMLSTPPENQSKLENNGPTDASCYLLMKTQFWNGSAWIDEDVLVNETTPRTLFPSEILKLDFLWNPLNYTTANLSNGDGTYRAYAECRDNESNILMNVNGSYVNATYNFTYDATPPLVDIISPPNNSNYTLTSAVPIHVNVTDASPIASVFANITYSIGYETIELFYNSTSGLWEVDYLNTNYVDTYTVTIVATDINGAVNDTESVVFNVIDITPPNVTLVAPPDDTENSTAILVNATFVCNVSDNYDVENISLYITNPNNMSFSLNGTKNVSGVYTTANFTLELPPGDYSWNCLAYDSSGNYDWGDQNYSFFNHYSTCQVISSPGSYQMDQNAIGAPHDASEVFGMNWACIKITTSNVLFDCNGYSVTNNGTALAGGIVINGSVAFDFTNVTVQNCSSVSDYLGGIYIHRSANDIIRNSVVHNTTYGFPLYGSTNNTLLNNTAWGNNLGFPLYISSFNNLLNNTAYNNSYGIEFNPASANNTAQYNGFYNNTYGVHITGSDNNLTHNLISNNTVYGIHLDSGNLNSLFSNYVCFNDQMDLNNSGLSNTGSLDSCDYSSNWTEFGHEGCEYTCSNAWHRFYGNLSGNLLLAPNNVDIFYNWLWDGQIGKVYAVNSDASISWANLTALGRNATGQNSTNDFTELDTLLNMSLERDSINNTYSSDGSDPLRTKNISIWNRIVPWIPQANSSSQTASETGIVWDASQDGGAGQFDPTENEDVAFVTEINSSMAYDYDIKVPANLSSYKGTSDRVSFWIELD